MLFDKALRPQLADLLAVGKQQHHIVCRWRRAQCPRRLQQSADGGRTAIGIAQRIAAVVMRRQQQCRTPRRIARRPGDRHHDVVDHADRVVNAAKELDDRLAHGGALHCGRQSHRAHVGHQVGPCARIAISCDRARVRCQYPPVFVHARGPRWRGDCRRWRRQVRRRQRQPGQRGEEGQSQAAGEGLHETRPVDGGCEGAYGIHRWLSPW